MQASSFRAHAACAAPYCRSAPGRLDVPPVAPISGETDGISATKGLVVGDRFAVASWNTGSLLGLMDTVGPRQGVKRRYLRTLLDKASVVALQETRGG